MTRSYPDVDPLLVETADRAFAATCTHDALEAAERNGWAPEVWAAVTDIGLDRISVPEDAGGAGGALIDALAVLFCAGRHAAPVPLGESAVLAGWLLSESGLRLGDGVTTVVPGHAADNLTLSGGRVSGTASRVPWGRRADAIVALVPGDDGPMVVVMDRADATVHEALNMAGEPRDTVVFDAAEPLESAAAGPGVDHEALACRGALCRATAMAGALSRANAITQHYAQERRQFGKPIGTFQAVQSHLVHLAQQAVLLEMAAATAGRAAMRGDARFEVAAAKVLAGKAAFIGARCAHQAHGAMGLTREYTLHHFTRRLWAWRDEFGDANHWADRVGATVSSVGADGLYPLITAGSAAL